MSEKCEKFGEHVFEFSYCKDLPGINNNFFYQGKFFEKEEEFWEYIADFKRRKTSEEDFDRLFTTLKIDIWNNLVLRNPDITNREVESLINELFMCFVRRMWANDNDLSVKSESQKE